jgi:hypothetical protein
VDGERTIAAKTRPRKRAAAEVAPATEMPAAKVPAAMAAEMATTVKMPTTAVTAAMATATVAASAFRGGIACGRQRGRKNKNGNSDSEF